MKDSQFKKFIKTYTKVLSTMEDAMLAQHAKVDWSNATGLSKDRVKMMQDAIFNEVASRAQD